MNCGFGMRYAAVPTLNLLMLVRLLVPSQPASSKVTTDMTCFRLPLVVLGSVSLSRPELPEPKPAHYEGAISDIKSGGLEHGFIFPIILGVIIPTDFHSIIFQRG